MEKYFYLDASPVYVNKYIIRMNHDKFLFPTGTTGSYAVFVARLLNLTYAEYLRYARDRLGAELVGKKSVYVTAYFDRNEATLEFVKLLNKRMEYIMHEHEFPYNYKEEDGKIERIPFQENENNIRLVE